MDAQARQRLRITYVKGEELRFISHLDLMRLVERALRRAEVPLAYSQGFNPRPRITIAAPLPVGFVGENEIMDVWLNRRTAPYHFLKRVSPHLPPGLEITTVEETYPRLPSLPSQVRAFEYLVTVHNLPDEVEDEIEERVERLLAAESLPRQREKRGKQRRYDLRELIESLEVAARDEQRLVLRMRLRAGSPSGRPEEVMEELGLEDIPYSVARTRLGVAP